MRRPSAIAIFGVSFSLGLASALAEPQVSVKAVPGKSFFAAHGAVGTASGADAGYSVRALRVDDHAALALARLSDAATDADGTVIAAFYAERGYSPLWTRDGRYAPRGREAIGRLRRAGEDGLDADAYATPSLVRAGEASVAGANAAEAEYALMRAILAYARHAQAGRVDPLTISRLITAKPEMPEARAALASVADTSDPAAALDAFNPQHAGYLDLKRKLAELRQARQAPQVRVKVPEGQALRPGARDTRVAVLRDRLGVMSDAEPEVYDDALAAAVREYQKAKGLGVDGVVGPQTLRFLNASPADREADIIANMERWRWLPRDLGRRHVRVNIPNYTVHILQDGEETYSGRVIVGTPKNQTPVFSNEISHIVVNPYWNVPNSIAVGEMLGQIRNDPYSLTRRGYEVVYNGRVIDPGRVDWWNVGKRLPVRIRQVPGERNALGNIKFMFPNDHAVYLHDTPQRTLFQKTMRAFSHGCVRVHDPFAFADALLSDEAGLNGARLKGMIGGRERWLQLDVHVPVHLTYFTTFVDGTGDLITRDDIYGHDRRLKTALGLEG